MKALIVGAGIAGLTAGVLLKRKNWDVLVLETRAQIGGNCMDYPYENMHIHMYGPHIFHTSTPRVWKFVNEFSGFNGYQHRVKALVPGWSEPLSIPYSKATAQEIGHDLTDDEIRKAFFVGYSEKMWGVPYDQIPAAITQRVQLRRDSHDVRYFLDAYQGMPAAGYHAMFNRMADEIGRSCVQCCASRVEWQSCAKDTDLLVYTGSLDEYFDLEFGRLPYRTIQFILKRGQPKLPCAVVNYCDWDTLNTRCTDFSRFYEASLDPDPSGFTTRCLELPLAWNWESDLAPAYPMRGFPSVDQQLAQYHGIPPAKNTVLCGRLGAYKYMNMDQTIADTMKRLEEKLGEKLYG